MKKYLFLLAKKVYYLKLIVGVIYLITDLVREQTCKQI